MSHKFIWSNFPTKAKHCLNSCFNPENVEAPTKTQLISSSSSKRVIPVLSPMPLLVGPSCQVNPHVETTNDQGNTISLTYFLCTYKFSAPGTSIVSTTTSHLAIQPLLCWKLTHQNKTKFCVLSSDKKELFLNVKALPDLFDVNIAHKLFVRHGYFGTIYKDVSMGTEHPAVTAKKDRIDAGQIHVGGQIMTPSFEMKIFLICEWEYICAIKGLHKRCSPLVLTTEPVSVVRQSSIDYCSYHYKPTFVFHNRFYFTCK
jgi:hypothetical protein